MIINRPAAAVSLGIILAGIARGLPCDKIVGFAIGAMIAQIVLWVIIPCLDMIVNKEVGL